MPSLLTTTMPTPAGPLTLVTDERRRLLAAGFTDDARELQARLGPERREAPLRSARDAGAVSDALAAYFDGALDALEAVPVDQDDQDGGAFTRRAWEALRAVPPGVTVTYTELAARAGNPLAIRAAGTACARNLIAPVVPCHRVVRTDGGLGGYAYGVGVKRALLDHERRHTPDTVG